MCMPDNVVAVSGKCAENLCEFFRMPVEHIQKIYNCVRDTHLPRHAPYRAARREYFTRQG